MWTSTEILPKTDSEMHNLILPRSQWIRTWFIFIARQQVQIGSPAQGELFRGDVITKIEDYDSRDLRHEDANYLFKNAGNRIRVVVQR